MKNLFDINLENIQVEYFQDSPIYKIDNFYKHPVDVINFIESTKLTLWKNWETPSYNGIHFTDFRHDIYDLRFNQVGLELEKICKQQLAQPSQIITNKIKFINYEFNDYFNNYWAPHRDLGYNGIVYLNTNESTGTNLYEEIIPDNWSEPEHYAPWRPKNNYKVIKTIDPKFNQLVMFDGKKFLHGMSITDDRFFKKDRFNQVLFFIE